MDLREQLQSTLGDKLILEQELGGGGMSRVFVAHESSLGRKVVVKVLPPEMAAAVSIDRFRREIQLAAQLQHPHIVPLLAAGDTNGLPYFTMPYVRGESLRARLLKAGELPLAETIRILRELASALAYAHEAGIVHRDIKPENILISGGSAVVTDFGVAKALTASSGSGGSLTSLGVALGTPAYMAPEQATADPAIDSRADIYSLGIVAYEMLTGVTPFTARSPQATLAAHVTEAPDAITKRRPTVPPLLAALVMKCLEKHAADRPQTATDVMHELDALSTPSGGTTPTTLLPAAKRKELTWRTVAIGAGALALIALAIFASRKVQSDTAASARADAPAIAVLPFENLGRKDGQEFADGMTEEITNRLSSLRGLRVIGRQSAKSYAGSTKTPQEIASELGVRYVLTGTVRWDKSVEGKDLVRVSPALLRTDDAMQVWAEAYQTVLSGMFEVQSKIATEVASALNITLLAPEKVALEARPTDNVEAYGYYLQGKEILDDNLQVGPIRESIALLEKATRADPRFVPAWAYLSMAHTELFWFNGDRTQGRLNLAEAALRKGASIQPDHPDMHLARAVLLYHGKRDYEGALRELDIASRQRPSDPIAALYAAAVNRRKGNWDAAVAGFKRSVDLEPRNGVNMIDLAETLAFLGRYGEAETYIDRAMVVSPHEATGPRFKAHLAIDSRGNVPEAIEHLRNSLRNVRPQSSLTEMLMIMTWPAVEDPSLRKMLLDARLTPDMHQGEFFSRKMWLFHILGDSSRMRSYGDSALAALERLAKTTPDPSGYYEDIAVVYAARGRRADALAAMARAEELLPPTKDMYVSSSRGNAYAVIYMLLGDKDAAISALEKSAGTPGEISRNWLRLDPRYASLRSNPRFQRLIQQ
jgi:eukaryotic-like serine/threonine-protein kinase